MHDIINKNFHESNGIVLAKSDDYIFGLMDYSGSKGVWYRAVANEIDRLNAEKALGNMTIGGKTISEAIDLIKSVDGVKRLIYHHFKLTGHQISLAVALRMKLVYMFVSGQIITTQMPKNERWKKRH